MPAFDLCIFDFDGTLADSFPWFCSILDQTSERFGLNRVKPEDIPALRDLPTREVLQHLGVPFYKLPAIATFMRALAVEGTAHIPPFPGATDALRTLHDAGVKLALVSSNAEAAVRTVLGPAASLIDLYNCGSSLWGKPEKFHAVLKSLGVPKDRVLAIGDEVRDIEAARKVGLKAGSITFGYNSRRALAEAAPDFLFDNYKQLLEVTLSIP